MDAVAELFCAGFIGFYLFFALTLVAAPMLRRKLKLQDRREQTMGQIEERAPWTENLPANL
jgi:hypothetical protein